MLPYDTPSPADLDRLMRGDLLSAPRLKNPRIPKAINDIIMKAMAPDIPARYQRAAICSTTCWRREQGRNGRRGRRRSRKRSRDRIRRTSRRRKRSWNTSWTRAQMFTSCQTLPSVVRQNLVKTEVVMLLLDHGADVHARDDSALRLAKKNHHKGTATFLKNFMKWG